MKQDDSKEVQIRVETVEFGCGIPKKTMEHHNRFVESQANKLRDFTKEMMRNQKNSDKNSGRKTNH